MCKPLSVPNDVGIHVRMIHLSLMSPIKETLKAHKWPAEDMKRRCITKQSSELAPRTFSVVGFEPRVRKVYFVSTLGLCGL